MEEGILYGLGRHCQQLNQLIDGWRVSSLICMSV